MKLVADVTIRPTWLNRHLYHFDPELLLRPLNMEQFSNILSDIYINGTWKKTGFGRLKQTELFLSKYYKNNNSDICRVLDVGVSDGSTSIDLLNHLKTESQIIVKIYMAERYLNLFKYQKYGFTEYRTDDGIPVMLKLWKMAIRLPKSEHKYALISSLLSYIYLQLGPFRNSMKQTGTIPLLQKQLLTNSDFELIEFDCLKPQLPSEIQFDLVRASNILNLAYFTRNQIKVFLRYIIDFIVTDGLLLISRNIEDGENNYEQISIWKKTKNKFDLLETMNDGTEIDNIVKSIE